MKKILVTSILIFIVILAGLTLINSAQEPKNSTNPNYNLNLEDIVEYTHLADSGEESQDCFNAEKTICLTRGPTSIIYNTGSELLQIAAFNCSSAKTFYTFDKRGWQNTKLDLGIGASSDIVGKTICLKTKTEGNWNLEFINYGGRNSGGSFAYTRTKA